MEVARARTSGKRRRGSVLAAGLVAGVCGGVLMGMFSMLLYTLLAIGGFWQPMNLIAAVLDQDWGEIAAFEALPTLLGIAIHLVTSAIIGLVFAWMVGGIRDQVVLKAIFAGLVVWVVAEFVVLPAVDPVMARVFPEWLFAAAHVVFGLGLGAYVAWRWPSEREPEPPSIPASAI